jgi:hypothetical protein
LTLGAMIATTGIVAMWNVAMRKNFTMQKLFMNAAVAIAAGNFH